MALVKSTRSKKPLDTRLIYNRLGQLCDKQRCQIPRFFFFPRFLVSNYPIKAINFRMVVQFQGCNESNNSSDWVMHIMHNACTHTDTQKHRHTHTHTHTHTHRTKKRTHNTYTCVECTHTCTHSYSMCVSWCIHKGTCGQVCLN